MRATSPAKEPKVLDHRLVDLDPGYIFHLEILMNVWSTLVKFEVQKNCIKLM